MTWDWDGLCSAAAAALQAEADRLDLEQAVLGLDAFDELALHPLLRAGLASTGCAVLAEQRYPDGRARRRRSEGERCDIVLLDDAEHARLLDPLEEGTLFASLGASPDDALWIEVKVAAQSAVIDGIARPNPRYSSVLLRDVPADARKLHKDQHVRWAAALIVVFNADAETAAHDVESWRARILERNVPLATPFQRTFSLTDRIGNGVCTVLLAPV
ncbi:MAG: hypothetical protein AAFX05_00750 [Planctomycetota bacterium]